jgi:aminoglycoside/choline kinase family phosphotransferase
MKPFFELTSWIDSLVLLKKIKLAKNWQINALKGDASSRRYFRIVSSSESYIVAQSPLDKIDNNVFFDIAKQWLDQGVNVPQVFALDEQNGFMLVEDLGISHLFDICKDHNSNYYYRQAIDQLLCVQKIQSNTLPTFDRSFLLREMMLFKDWFVEQHLMLTTPDCVLEAFEVLIQSALTQPQLVMHRDYHSKNLLITNDNVSIIDFQDAVIGPVAYDLVSLLRDCYVSLTDAQLEILQDYYLTLLNESKLLSHFVSKDEFVVWFDLIGLQRHLKVLGLFIRLAVQEGKGSYLDDLPRVYHYVESVSAKYQQLKPFHQWLKTEVEPKVRQQVWYK